MRQRNWTNSGASIWEMFFNESIPGNRNPPFDNFGSSCLLHADANNYLVSNKLPNSILWDNKDLNAILPKAMDFRRIAYNILVCNFGKLLKIEDYALEIESNDKRYKFKVPVYPIPSNDFQYDDSAIQSFMKESGLQNYICIDIKEF
jgi:hypothetical protein